MRTSALLLLFLPLSAGAVDVPSLSFSGRAFEDLYLPTKDHVGTTFEQASTSLWLQGDTRISNALAARAEYQGDFFANARLTGDRPGPHLRNRLREGWTEYFANGFQVRVGKQIIPWGKSDGINPTDFLTARESNFLNHDAEVTRVGGVALLASYTPSGGASPASFTIVAQPWFPKGDYLVPAAAIPRGVSIGEVQEPGRSTRNTEVAGKAAYAGDGWDASVSYFHGFDHRPVFAETSHAIVSPTAYTVNAQRIFQRVNAAGADASYSGGPWVYRFETAYLWTEGGKSMLLIPSHWDLVVGAERPFLDNFRVQAQLVSRYFPDWSDPAAAPGPDAVSIAINRQIAAANALLQQYQHRWGTASTLRISYALEQPAISAELLWYEGLNDGDYYLRPMLSYGVLESLRWYLGYDHYGGPADKSIGSLQTYNAVFTEVKLSF